jgi:hypothetical protein
MGPRLFGSEAAVPPATLLLELRETQVPTQASNERTKEPKSVTKIDTALDEK